MQACWYQFTVKRIVEGLVFPPGTRTMFVQVRERCHNYFNTVTGIFQENKKIQSNVVLIIRGLEALPNLEKGITRRIFHHNVTDSLSNTTAREYIAGRIGGRHWFLFLGWIRPHSHQDLSDFMNWDVDTCRTQLFKPFPSWATCQSCVTSAWLHSGEANTGLYSQTELCKLQRIV